MKNHKTDFFAQPIDPHVEARALTKEAMTRMLLWMADAPNAVDRGLRTSAAIYCVRPAPVDAAT